MDFAAIIASILALFAPLLGGIDNAPIPAQLSSVVSDDWDDDWDDRWDDDHDDDWEGYSASPQLTQQSLFHTISGMEQGLLR